MHIMQSKHSSTYITYITFKHFISIISIQHNKPHMASQSTRLRLIHNPVSLLTCTVHTRPQTLIMLSSNHPTTSSFINLLVIISYHIDLFKRGWGLGSYLCKQHLSATYNHIQSSLDNTLLSKPNMIQI